PRVTALFKSPNTHILRDMEVDFDGSRIMFSSIGAHGRWALFEMKRDGSGVKQITPTDLPDVDFFDSCYLPDGRVVTCSTACYQGLPCIGGGRPMVNLYLLDREKDSITQLTFEQDSDYHPCVLHNGRVLYLRWEYSDIQHYFSRIVFSCNPDGTNQMEYYGSGSYFPTAFKHARPMPGHPRKIVGIISGHHATPETGRMAIIDPGLARKYPLKYKPESKEWGKPGATINLQTEVLPAEKTGFVQEIPGYGKPVVGNVYDGQGSNVYPNFVYPYPLSDKYIIVSMKRDRGALWGLYLVDVYDNMTLLYEEEGAGLFDAMPFEARERPPVIPDRVVPGAKTASVYLTDVYTGPGLKGIPKGTVKRLRLFAYHFAYNHTGGHASVGTESSWDIKRILGTVPVEADGSANFLIPANTPISIQPLDSEGRALQIMRSWLVGKPGERVSCGGCHENQNMASANKYTAAARRAPTPIEGWRGDARPFAFKLEVYPVLEKHCGGCHDGNTKNGRKILSFKDDGTAYKNIHPYVRRPGPESDMDLTQPMEWHASTSPLVQMLDKGHHNVQLDREAWERLYCWIDLNAPYRGSWRPREWRGQDQAKRRLELAARYAGINVNPEDTYAKLEKAFATRKPVAFVKPAPTKKAAPDGLEAKGFPFTAEQAKKMQGDAQHEVDLGNGQKIRFVRIPAGGFVMGSQAGYADEAPRAVVGIEKPYSMGVCEISNAQYAAFDPEHDTRYYDEHGKDQALPGYIGNHADQPVARVSWEEAMAFCAWLSKKTGKTVTLPTESQWEWAARAGSGDDFYYGGHEASFAEFANLSDHTRLFTQTGWDGGSKIHKRRSYDPKHHFPLREDRCDDKSMVTNYVGQYKANAWGLKDMIGNVCEWTRSSYGPYPYKDGAGAPADRKVARGGSWHDRSKTATASIRFAYQPYQKVFNVGFRVIVAEAAAGRTALAR
ncbi:SUMF1/EgtB/PvdO family nonheme iron enzyme, partial [bacterium]|nr:SUMF1/EgtB/PvdO family nonheme iron enzyme [bacterium]